MADSGHTKISAIFDIYKMTKDKMEFIENLGLIYDFAYIGKFKIYIIIPKNLLKIIINNFFS